MTIDINQRLSQHFQLVEFLHNGSTEGVTPEIMDNLKRLCERLEAARTLCGNRPFRITSGFRTPAHNAEVGGKPDSLHLRGMAADFTIDGLKPSVVQTILHDWDGGMEYAPTWTHLDIGTRRRFWP